MFTEVIVPAGLAVMMLGVGATLEVADFARVARVPRAAVVGWTTQVVVLPPLAFAIAATAGLDPATAVGLVLVAACPGGVFSNVMAWLARGDAALSVTLTALSTCSALVALPAWLHLALSLWPQPALAGDLALGRSVVGVALMTVVPVALGVAARARWPGPARAAERPFAVGSLVFLAGVLAFVAWQQRGLLADHATDIVPAVLALNVLTVLAGLGVAAAARLDRASTLAVAMEMGVQNAGLGMAVAVGMLGSSAVAVPAAIYLLFTFFTSGALVVAGRRGRVVADAGSAR